MNIEEAVCVLCVLTLASDSLETIEVIIVKLGTVTASGVKMRHMLIMLTLTFIQGHTNLIKKIYIFYYFSNVQAVPIRFAVKIV